MSRKLSTIKGKIIKSDCGFYLRLGIKSKPKKHLDMSYFDKNNEFQLC